MTMEQIVHMGESIINMGSSRVILCLVLLPISDKEQYQHLPSSSNVVKTQFDPGLEPYLSTIFTTLGGEYLCYVHLFDVDYHLVHLFREYRNACAHVLLENLFKTYRN